MLPHFPEHDTKVISELPVPNKVLGKRKNSKDQEVDFTLADWVVDKLKERDDLRDERLNKRIDKILAVMDASDPANTKITAGHLRKKLDTGWRDMFTNPNSQLD